MKLTYFQWIIITILSIVLIWGFRKLMKEKKQDETQEESSTPPSNDSPPPPSKDSPPPPDDQKCVDKCLNSNGVFDNTIAGCECLMPEVDENCNRKFNFNICQPVMGLDSGEILTQPVGYSRLPASDVGFHSCNMKDFEFAGKGDDFDELSECQAACENKGTSCKGFTLYNKGDSRSCYIHTGEIAPEPKLGAQCFKKMPPTIVSNPGCYTEYSYMNPKKESCEPGKENRCVQYKNEQSCSGSSFDINGDGTGDCQWLNDVQSCCINSSEVDLC